MLALCADEIEALMEPFTIEDKIADDPGVDVDIIEVVWDDNCVSEKDVDELVSDVDDDVDAKFSV